MRPRPAARVLAVALLSVVLSGCFQIRSVLTVRADGSAQLRDEVTLSGMALMALMDEDTEDDAGPLDRSAFEDRALALGEGVTLSSFEPREDGFTAVYEVPDVEALRYSAPELPSGDATASGDELLDVSFLFEAGDPATLRIVVPKPEPEKPSERDELDDEPTDPEEQTRMIRMMRALMDEARMTIAVEVDGEVVETNAAYADGPRVTVLDLDMGTLLDAAESDPSLMENGPATSDAFYELAERTEGLTMVRPGTIRVRFR